MASPCHRLDSKGRPGQAKQGSTKPHRFRHFRERPLERIARESLLRVYAHRIRRYGMHVSPYSCP